jgi:hypothetical protein
VELRNGEDAWYKGVDVLSLEDRGASKRRWFEQPGYTQAANYADTRGLRE